MKGKITAVILGLVVMFILLEIALRIIGSMNSRNTTNFKASVKKEDEYVILCIGDSFTEGIAVPKDKDYPSQLENKLKQNIRFPHFTVVNAGASTYNTTMILKKFRNTLQEIDPDLVIVLAGGANFWNSLGFTKYLKKTGLKYNILEFLYDVKIYRLIRLIALNLKQKNNPRKYDSANGQYIEQLPPEVHDLLEKCYERERKGDHFKAIQCVKDIVRAHPDNGKPYLEIGRMCLEHFNATREAKKWIKLAIKHCPTFESLTKFGQAMLRRRDDGDMDFLYNFKNTIPGAEDVIAMVSRRKKFQKITQKWVVSDLEAIIGICRNSGIKVIFLTYPDYGDNPDIATTNNLLQDIAYNNAIPLVDNKKIFDQLLSQGGKKSDYFAPDKCHCNANGYRIMSDNIYKLIMELKLIKELVYIDDSPRGYSSADIGIVEHDLENAYACFGN
ncbi:MAG: GDSL-type esterase/lipase family protein [Deltaproteobacteria bacterium]